MRSYKASAALRGVFAGAGSDGLNEVAVCEEILRLTGKAASPASVTVAYLGTATYDLPNPRNRQTAKLAAMGCRIVDCPVALPNETLGSTELSKTLAEEADVVIVSGGNTLYAMDRWKQTGVDAMLRQAMERGCVLAGGSAGAICWFDAGHSDSADPDTFRPAMIAAASAANANKDESSGAPTSPEAAKSWRYIRVGCLGFLPGLVCPHHDKVQSNGVLRAHDFDAMLGRHPTERGICIDHWAALVVEGDKYSVLAVPGKPGSLLESGGWSETQSGVPACWVKEVEQNGSITRNLVPTAGGSLSDLLRYAKDDKIVVDADEEVCRAANPTTQ